MPHARQLCEPLLPLWLWLLLCSADHCMAALPWGVVIIDESHNLRTTNSRQADSPHTGERWQTTALCMMPAATMRSRQHSIMDTSASASAPRMHMWLRSPTAVLLLMLLLLHTLSISTLPLLIAVAVAAAVYSCCCCGRIIYCRVSHCSSIQHLDLQRLLWRLPVPPRV